jgi:NADPH:quinone reductase-like Zn-dependent oxidoreductase
MQAIVFTQYGSPDVLELKEVETPTPGDNEVLIRVYAAAVNAADWHLLRGEPFPMRLMFGLHAPKYQILGIDVAGRVEAVGRSITQFQLGDEVFGDLSNSGFGTFAEYVTSAEDAVAQKPARLTFEQAAAIPVSAVTALQALRDHGHIQAGHKVLITGAAGGVGTFAVQLAKAFGADVTGICSTKKVEMVRSLGADQVIDYTQEDVTRNEQQYDLILDAAAYRSIFDYRRILRDDGRYVMIGGATGLLFQAMLLGPLISLIGKKKMGNMLTQPAQKDLVYLSEMVEAGKVTPIIDQCYPLAEAAEAVRYVEAGHARGKVIITMNHVNDM